METAGLNPSHTAQATAWLRAAHQLFEVPPRVLEDPLALRLLGAAAEIQIRESTAHYSTPAARALRAHVVLRARFAEDRLEEAVRRGVTQYVLLGAGFDTFSLRQPAWAAPLRIVEVDHAGTQGLKRARLAEAGLTPPGNVSFAQIDFERESLHEGLARQGVSLDEPSFFSWLGVTMYLKDSAIDAVLASIARFPSGSEVVLTFLQPSQAGSAAAELAEQVAQIGEPFVSRFTPQAMAQKLSTAGFARVHLLDAAEAVARYFARPSGLPLPHKTQIAWAIR